jgi:hypothetical protein
MPMIYALRVRGGSLFSLRDDVEIYQRTRDGAWRGSGRMCRRDMLR